MFSTLRTRFGIPGVISVIALVFAMLGGAYAASNSSSGGKATASKAKKAKAKRGPRGPKGATGPAGPAGPAGPKGDTGAAGSNGTNGVAGVDGSPGTSVTNTALPVGNANCPEGGAEFKVGTGAPTRACNGLEGPQGNTGNAGPEGPQGSPWVAGKAPSGVLIKGTWSIPGVNAAAPNQEIPIALSTGVPIDTSTIFNTFVAPTGTGDPNHPVGCIGTATEPTSTMAGVVCIYESVATNITFPITSNLLSSSGGGEVAIVKATAAGPASAYGTWALLTP